MVTDARIASALDRINAGLDELAAAGCEPSDDRDAITLVRELEEIGRRAAAAQLDVLDAIDRRSLHRADGHATPKSMLRHVAELSPGEAAARDKTMRMRRDLPAVAEALDTGRLGADHAKLLGRVHANPRVRDAMADAQEWFLEQAVAGSYRDFELAVRRWERLTDQDGPEPANERTHRNRDARLVQDHFELSWNLAARYAAMQGASMREIFDHYIDAELRADWEKARAEHGADACFADLPRTDAQRRADALWQIFMDAAAAEPGAVPPGFVHNVVWDAATFEEMVARIDGAEPQPLDPDTHRCETIDGVPLEPTEAAACAMVSAVRRVLVDAAGTVIDQGRARSFTGGARHAVKLASTTCVWPGCHVPTSRCEADHLIEHSRRGRTDPGNGAPLCGRHNRWKQKGFAVRRSPDGEWHTYRADGTEVP